MKSKLCLSAAVLALALGLGTNSVFAANSQYFHDVTENNYGWAAEAVDYLHENDVASGVGYGMFSPEAEIERGDFAVLINRAFKLKDFNTYMVSFSDVDKDDYYYQAIVNAKGVGIIKDDYVYRPEAPILRGDAMLMLYTALSQDGYVTKISTDLSMYSDESDVLNVNTRLALGTLTQMGIISGSDGKILYDKTMSRAEMAMIFYKTLEYMKENGQDANAATYNYNIDRDTKKNDTDKAKKDTEKTDNENKTKKGENYLSDADIKTPVIINGEEYNGIEDSNIRVSDASANSVEVSGNVNAEIVNSKIHATGSGATALFVSDGSSAEVTDTELYANNANASAVRGKDGSSVTVNNGTIQAKDKKSAGIRTAGKADVTGGTFTVSTGAAAVAEDKGEISIEKADITADGISGGLFTSMKSSSKSSGGEAEINVKECTVTGDRKTTLFYADNNDLTATLENCDIKKVGKLVDSRIDNDKKSGNTIEITLINQELEADVICDEKSTVIIRLKEGSKLKGSINNNKLGKCIEIYVDKDSTLELTTDCYIDVLVFEDPIDIIENGRTIYYDADREENYENKYVNRDDEYPLVHGGIMQPK